MEYELKIDVSGVCIGRRRIIEAVVADPDLKIPHGRRKIVAAGRAVWVVEPKRLPQVGQAVARNGPVGNVIMDLLGVHVVDVLQILLAAQHGAGAVELPRLEYHIADGVVTSVFTHTGPYSVHHD